MDELRDNNKNIVVMDKITKHIIIDIEGNDNNVCIKSKKLTHTLNLTIRGDNNCVRIGEDVAITKELDIFIGGSNIYVEIGKGTTIGQAIIRFAEDDSRLEIGEDCMISDEVEVWGTDMHGIIDKKSYKVTNRAKEIVIKNHCWLGAKSMIMKNVHLNEGCIVAAGAIVTADFPANVMIGGTPARIIKKDIEWVRESPKLLVASQCDNFINVIENEDVVVNIEEHCDNDMIKGWGFLKDVDSKFTDIYLEFIMTDDQHITFSTNKERREDVAAAYQDKKYGATGFWFLLPKYLKKTDIRICRVICKNENIIRAKKIEM